MEAGPDGVASLDADLGNQALQQPLLRRGRSALDGFGEPLPQDVERGLGQLGALGRLGDEVGQLRPAGPELRGLGPQLADALPALGRRQRPGLEGQQVALNDVLGLGEGGIDGRHLRLVLRAWRTASPARSHSCQPLCDAASL